MMPRLRLAALPLLFVLSACCAQPEAEPPAPLLLASHRTQALMGDGKLQPGEQCDDRNTEDGDGCSSTGALEPGFLCHVPGQACSAVSLCGNNLLDSGEACDDGNPADSGNGCTATCDLSRCGDGAFDNLSYPSFSQEICDDGNRFDGDGCSRLCEVEPGFACAGFPSRCIPSGVTFFNTGVDSSGRRLVSGPDPHWFYTGTATGAETTNRLAGDWPRELQTARFMAELGSAACVYQEFFLPANLNLAAFRLRLAFFNDNSFLSASVNGVEVTPAVISEPDGLPWRKNTIREFGPLPQSPWQAGSNRIELCNQNVDSPPNAFRYLFVDAYDDHCGDGVLSPREQCDDGNTTPGDGCDASCGMDVDAVAPEPPTFTTPTQGAVVNPSPDLGGLAEPGSRVTVYEDSTVLCTATATAGGAWSCTPSQPLDSGTHSLSARATDTAGNTSQSSSLLSLSVDTQAPDTFITRSPPSLDISGGGTDFEFSSNESPVGYECGLDKDSFTPCQDSWLLAPGVHTLKVRAVDAVGNADPSPAEYTWTVKVPHLAGGGCSAAPWPASWLALLALAALRRRSR